MIWMRRAVRSFIRLMLLQVFLSGGLSLSAVRAQDPAGVPLAVSRVEVRGARSMKSAELSRAVSVYAGGKFSEEELAGSCSRLLRLYGDAGYPWAQVKVFVQEVGAGGREVLFSIEEGRRARVGDINYTGNTLTKNEVLARQTGVREGEQFSLSGIEDAKMRLAAWDMYEEVRDIAVYEGTHPYRVTLLVPVVESKPHNLSGMLGFGPGKDGARRVWGNAHFLMKNIMGTARRLEMRWSQAALLDKSMQFSYREPWLGGTPVSGEASFSQRVREASFTQIELGAGASAVFSRLGRLGLGFAHEILYPQGEGDDPVPRSTKESLRASMNYRRPAGQGRPSLVSLTLTASLGFRKAGGERTKETIIDSSFETIMWRRGMISARVLGGLRAAYASDDVSPDYLTVPFGGSSTVRGHREGELYCLRALWAQSELSFLNWGAGEIHVFFDQALAAQPLDALRLDTTYLSGYGAGMSAVTAVGKLQLDLALAQGRGLSRAMLHVGMSEEF
jgi:outer membrane protein assembly factor BamA